MEASGENDCGRLLSLIRKKDLEGVKLWLNTHGAIWCPEGSVCFTSPLTLASQTGCPEVVAQLIEAGYSPFDDKRDISTPMRTAAEKGCLDVVKLLIESYHVSVNSHKQGENSALMEFVLHRDEGAVSYLISKGADINYRRDIDTNTCTALQIAVVLKEAQLVRILIDSGANLEVQSEWGSLFNLAVVKSNFKIIKILYEAGARPDQLAQGENALHIVLSSFVNSWYHIRLLKYLLSINLSLCVTNQDGHTPLSAGLTFSRFGVIRWLPLLLAFGSPVRALDREITTDRRVLSLLDTYVCTVKSLQQLCCFTIRRRLGTRIQSGIHTLGLPSKVKRYILLDHILRE